MIEEALFVYGLVTLIAWIFYKAIVEKWYLGYWIIASILGLMLVGWIICFIVGKKMEKDHNKRCQKVRQTFDLQPVPRIFTKNNSEIWVPILPEIEEIAAAYPDLTSRRVFSPYPIAKWANERQNFRHAKKYSPQVCAYSGQQLAELEMKLTTKGFFKLKLSEFKQIIEDWHLYLNKLKGRTS